MKIGAQLFTVREYTKTLEAFEETLKRVADIGYTSVQVSGTCAFEAEWLAEKLKSTGLTCDLTHTAISRIVNETEQVVKDHKTFGCKYIGVGAMPGINKDNKKELWVSFVSLALPAANKLKESGCYFMYHNHAAEYHDIDGEICMNYLKKSFAPDEMGFTLDTHWVKAGGYDPIEQLVSLKGRIPCIHLKDLITMEDGTRRFAPVGSGELDFEKIVQAAIDGGTEFAFVEQDNCYGESPFDCLKKSYDYLKSLGLR